jgi:hypothetical protein
LHHPAYNFDDDAIVYGTSYWIKLVENTLVSRFCHSCPIAAGTFPPANSRHIST